MLVKYYFDGGSRIMYVYFKRYFFVLRFFNVLNLFFWVYKKCEFFRFFNNFNFIVGNFYKIYSVRLFFNGVGYKILKIKKRDVYKDFFKIDLGFSVKIYIRVKKFLKVKTYRNKIFIFGFDKCFVNKFAKFIYNLRKPDAYKGKGVRYLEKEFKFKKGKQR